MFYWTMTSTAKLLTVLFFCKRLAKYVYTSFPFVLGRDIGIWNLVVLIAGHSPYFVKSS